jgi:O-antigen/teichoic acid export membrane protein
MPISNKSIITHFFSGTVFIGVARVFTIVLGLVSVMLATRYLTTDAYGAYVLVMLFSNVLAQFISFGLGLAIPRYLASKEDENYKTTLINTVLHFMLIVVITVGLSIVTFKPVIEDYLDSTLLKEIFTAVPIVFLMISLAQLLESILRGLLEFRAIGVIEFTSEVVELVLLILLVVVYRFGFWGLIIAKAASRTIWIAFAYRAIRFKHKWELDAPLLKEMLKFGLPLQVQNIFDFAFSKIDTLIVGTLLGTRGVAFYDIARKIPDSLMELYSVFISVYFPLSANVYALEKRERSNYVLNNSIRLVTFLSVFAALIIAFFGRDIILLLFSEEYLASYWVLVLLMIGLILDMIEELLGYSLVAIGEPDKTLYINIMKAVISLVGNLIILPIIGYIGAAIIYILGNLIALPANVFFLRRNGLSPNLIAPLKLFLIFILLFFSLLLWNPGIIPSILILALLYIPLSFFLSVITIRDMSILLGEVSALWRKLRDKLFVRLDTR